MASSTAGIGRVARARVKEGIVRIVLRQAWAELLVTFGRDVHFRRSENAQAVRAYCAMTQAEFDGINARQRWANWRTIPRNLRGRLPPTPCRAVDLCSGTGDSAEVLAHYLPSGSEILGLEYNPEFVRKARVRRYRDADGRPVKASFRAQSVLETFRDERGEPLEAASVDLVNSCGSLGLHFDAAGIERLAAEVARVLKPGGLAALDSGARGVGRREMARIFRRFGFEEVGSARSCPFDRYTQVCFRRLSSPTG